MTSASAAVAVPEKCRTRSGHRGAAAIVSGALIVIGVILINRNETMTLANSVEVYDTLPGGIVITKQLLSLSFSLGAFAAFFLVAAQRPVDRKAFMKNVLVRYRGVQGY